MKEEPVQSPVNMELLALDYFTKADIEAYIFSLKTMLENGLPEEMNREMTRMVNELVKLDEALKKYPSNHQQAHRFMTYYIPEVIRVTYSYLDYEKSGVALNNGNPVYNKVMGAIHMVATAAEQRVSEIYKIAAMNMVAKADALQRIIGQDGYHDGDQVLRH